MKVDIYNKKGKKLTTKIELNDKVFAIKPNDHSIYLAVKSELASKRVAKVGDVVKEGDEVSVKVVGFDRGKVKLSIKQAVA